MPLFNNRWGRGREKESFVCIIAQRPFTICVIFLENHPKFTILALARDKDKIKFSEGDANSVRTLGYDVNKRLPFSTPPPLLLRHVIGQDTLDCRYLLLFQPK